MLVLGGSLGVSDKKIGEYFHAHKVKYDKIETVSKLKSKIGKYRISIIYVRNNRSISRHYFCVIKRYNKFLVLNYYNNLTKLIDFSWSMCDKNHFIRAYCFK